MTLTKVELDALPPPSRGCDWTGCKTHATHYGCWECDTVPGMMTQIPNGLGVMLAYCPVHNVGGG